MLDVISSSRKRFSPLQLSPALWLDASDASTLYDATTGGSLVAADGVVARWEDKSGNARHATQATLANRPQRKTGIKNGKDIIRFDGTKSMINSVAQLATTSGTIFVTANRPGAGTDQLFFQAGSLSAKSGVGISIHSSPAVRKTYVYGSVDVLGTNSTIVSNMVSKFDSSLISFYQNSILANSLAVTGISIGAGYYIGSFSGLVYLIGDILEIIVFPSALSDTNRLAVESYLNTKWAVY